MNQVLPVSHSLIPSLQPGIKRETNHEKRRHSKNLLMSAFRAIMLYFGKEELYKATMTSLNYWYLGKPIEWHEWIHCIFNHLLQSLHINVFFPMYAFTIFLSHLGSFIFLSLWILSCLNLYCLVIDAKDLWCILDLPHSQILGILLFFCVGRGEGDET